ncbi:type IV secretory system conjugative DNA transfer family protein, partial [Hyphococcus sp.]|uniref:type IV secretory system conjugative DNA transfer family protein n=2 Tax=Hyphococcus sp. TaxID=2038636 RepID=UPI0035C6BBE6
GLYRDPTIARVTSRCDWKIDDLMNADRPVSLYLVVPPSDISRTKPLVRLILNQIGRRLTEELESNARVRAHRLLVMLDEFPALGRLDFFESALAFMAGYGVRAYLIAQSLNQIEKAYGANNSILDNCHVRIAFAANDERTAKRISDSLGTATELRAQKNYAGHRLAPWLAHVMVSRQETARPLLTPGEVMQLPPNEAIAMVSGVAPIRAQKLQYFRDQNFTARCLAPPDIRADHGFYTDAPKARDDNWSGIVARTDARLSQPWFDMVKGEGENDDGGHAMQHEFAMPTASKPDPEPSDPSPSENDDDVAQAKKLQDIARTATQRAAVMDRHPDSITPSF